MQSKEKAMSMFFRVRPIEVLLSLNGGPKYASIISMENNCTYSHTVKLLNEFKKLGLVDFDKKGRIKIVKLTEEGQNIAAGLSNVVSRMRKIKSKG